MRLNPAGVSVSDAPSPVPASVVQEQLQLGVTMEIRVYDLTMFAFADIKLTFFQDSVPPPRAPPRAMLTDPPPGSPPMEKSPNINQQPMVCLRLTSFD